MSGISPHHIDQLYNAKPWTGGILAAKSVGCPLSEYAGYGRCEGPPRGLPEQAEIASCGGPPLPSPLPRKTEQLAVHGSAGAADFDVRALETARAALTAARTSGKCPGGPMCCCASAAAFNEITPPITAITRFMALCCR